MSNLEDYLYMMGFDLAQSALSWMVSLAGYIMVAVGLYTLAKRRGIRNPWLAWIPFGQSWMLGCISDQYQHVTMRRKKNKRTFMLWLDIANFVLMAITMVLLINALVEMARYVDLKAFMQYGEDIHYQEELLKDVSDAELMQMVSSMMRVLLPCFVMLGTTISLTVLKYMAMYDLYRSCEPNSAVAYMLVSFLLGTIATGVLMILCRNKDYGMKPCQYYGYQQPGLPPEQNWQPPQEPWQQPPNPWDQNNP